MYAYTHIYIYACRIYIYMYICIYAKYMYIYIYMLDKYICAEYLYGVYVCDEYILANCFAVHRYGTAYYVHTLLRT